MRNLGKRTGITEATFTKIIEDIEERISGVQNIIEENLKPKTLLKHNIWEIWKTINTSNLEILGIEGKEFQLLYPENIFKKIIAKNFLTKKKDTREHRPQNQLSRPHGCLQQLSNNYVACMGVRHVLCIYAMVVQLGVFVELLTLCGKYLSDSFVWPCDPIPHIGLLHQALI